MTTSAPAPDTTSKAALALCSLWQWVRAEVEHFDGPMPDDFIVELVEDAMTDPTAAKRQEAKRQRRAAAGLVRVELYAHPDDVPAIKALATELHRVRKPGRPATKEST